MLLVTLGIVFLISLLFFRLMRRLFWVFAAIAVVVIAAPHLPIHNRSWQSLALVLGLFGHLTRVSVTQGLHQYERWGQHILAHHRL